MLCPGCGVEMERLTLAGSLGAEIAVDLCRRCRAFWFDPYEDLHLTVPSTIRLLQVMAEGASSAAPFPQHARCPYCATPLKLTHDRQRNTPFVYWRCEQGHGRFTPYAEFLREKDFIRQPTPAQLKELRKSIQMIRCSGCGAPIDLLTQTACTHCGSPVSILDIEKLAELSASTRTAPPPPQRLLPPRLSSTSTDTMPTLVDLGLEMVWDWLRGWW